MGCTSQKTTSSTQPPREGVAPVARADETEEEKEQKISEQAEMVYSRKKQEILDYTTLLREYSLLSPQQAEAFDMLDTQSNMMISPLAMHKFISEHGYSKTFVQMLKDLQSKAQYQDEMFIRPQVYKRCLEINDIVLE